MASRVEPGCRDTSRFALNDDGDEGRPVDQRTRGGRSNERRFSDAARGGLCGRKADCLSPSRFCGAGKTTCGTSWAWSAPSRSPAGAPRSAEPTTSTVALALYAIASIAFPEWAPNDAAVASAATIATSTVRIKRVDLPMCWNRRRVVNAALRGAGRAPSPVRRLAAAARPGPQNPSLTNTD